MQQQQGIVLTHKMSINLSFLDKLVEDLIKTKRSNYSEDCINFYISQSSFIMEDLPSLYNSHQEKIKCTLIKHRLNHKEVHRQSNTNKKCVIYLHGLGSSRLQALSLVDHLPKNYCLAMFDLSGSGKSEGQYITYGLKQYKDINPVITYLHRKKYIRQFVIWGRSMGAVATLLYAIENCSQKQKTRQIKRESLKIRSERNSSLKTIVQFDQEPVIKAIVLDSPFHNFRQIAKEIALKKLNIPNFIIQIALNYLQQSLNRILNLDFGSKYNPFNINFQKQIKLQIPIIFMYSQHDQIIPFNHCQRIIKNVTSSFQKLLINQCSHNQTRPSPIIKEVFSKLQKFHRQKSRQKRKLTQECSKQLIKNDSLQKKRGIFVFTPSKQLKKAVQQDKKNVIKFHEIVDIDQIKTEQVYVKSSSRNRISATRRSYINIESSRQLKSKKATTKLSENITPYINTIDIETNKIIGKKLIELRQNDTAIPFKTLRSKRNNGDKKKEAKLNHDKYLQ